MARAVARTTARSTPRAAAAWLGLVIAAAIGCSSPSNGAGAPSGPDKPAPVTQPADNCTSSDDCDLVDACCGCMTGGSKIAIRKDAVAAFQASAEQRCGGTMCPQFVSHDPSCDAEAVCGSRGHCRVMPHMQHQ